MDAPVRLPVALIYPSDHGRAVQAQTVTALADSMAAIGLRTPITVRPVVKVADGRDIDAYEIVTGRHRYEAALCIRWREIDCFVLRDDEIDAKLWEIDENLMRAELTPAQVADHMARRKQLWEARNSVASCNTMPGRPKEFSTDTAERTGVNRSTVHRAVTRGEKIAPDVLQAIVGTELDKGTALDRLAKMPVEQQRKTVSEVKLPAEPLNEFEATQKQVAALMSAWNKAGPEAREQFMARVDRPVFDKTGAGRAA